MSETLPHNTNSATLLLAPSGDKNIKELLLQFQPIIDSTLIAENTLHVNDSIVDGILWGADLAPGIQILDWKATIRNNHRIISFQHNETDSEPVWTLLICDYPIVSLIHQPEEGVRPQSNICYLYNLQCPIHLNLRASDQSHLLFIRIKQSAWEQIFTQPTGILASFLSARSPSFFGFAPTYKQQLLLTNSFQTRPITALERWACMLDVLQLIYETCNQLEQRNPTSSKPQRLRSSDAERITQAHDLLLADFQTKPNVEAICRQVGLGRDKFRRLFRHVYSLAPYEYFQQRRMDEARRMLETGDYSVMDVGHRVGYDHMGHFAQTFKKYQGGLPSEFVGRAR